MVHRSYNTYDQQSEMALANAAKVFILMPKDVPVSRSTRFQWLLDHLNSVITVPTWDKLDHSNDDLEVISVVPTEECHANASEFLVTSTTKLVFLSHVYRLVYCLDMSPSQSAVDIEQGQILFDEIINCFQTSLLGLCKEFTIPGSSLVHRPWIYLTVIVNTPFFISPAQQVIVKGVCVSCHNVQEIISLVQAQFHHLEGRIADVSAKAYDQIDQQMMDNDVMVGGLFDLIENDCIANVPMVSPDVNFVNMLRYSMLAISLLPENSLSHILIITDGVVAMPDTNILESLLYQLHYDSIAVSFLRVGSLFKPYNSAGYVPYTDLLTFLSHSTLGTLLESFQVIKPEPTLSMNVYQELYLLWTFHTCLEPIREKQNNFNLNNLHINEIPPLLNKKHAEEKINSSVLLLVSRRMREGYTINEVHYSGGVLKIRLTLHWKTFIFIHYELVCSWPTTKPMTHFEIDVTAPYEFLHDITCIIKKETKSSYREAVFERFWIRSTQLASGDILLAQQLSAFQSSNVWYSLPDSVRSGIPVFILNNNSTGTSNEPYKPSLPSNDASTVKFSQLWKPICSLDTSNWRKWFHMHKLSVIMKHDHQLPTNMHLSNSSGRFQVIQCIQAATALYGLLSEWCTFVLVDQHTYLKILHKDVDKSPNWFLIIRITSKLPCITINMGFITGTPGTLRHQICNELKLRLKSLSYISTPLKTVSLGCTLVHKPLEKILIRYERIPTDFHTVIFPDGTQNSVQKQPTSPLAGALFTTLSRYLFHQRWIWSGSQGFNEKLDVASIARILGTLTRMRLKEGFDIAHSASGILTMVLELQMDNNSSCVVQYVIFPPHHIWWPERDSSNGSEDDVDVEPEPDSDLQIVTEVWIEPQFGSVVMPSTSTISYMNGKRYYELADVIKHVDMQCINSLLTLEYLSMMCKERVVSAGSQLLQTRKPFRHYSSDYANKNGKSNYLDKEPHSHWNPTLVQRIQHIPFNFDPINVLPLCQQTELLFSMFIEDPTVKTKFNTNDERSNELLMDDIHRHLLYLNDYELDLSPEESKKFTYQVLSRHKNETPNVCPLQANFKELSARTHWKCYVKGITVTHVIMTMVPASLSDLKLLILRNKVMDNNIFLPMYVYDCPLNNLVEFYIKSTDNCIGTIKDVYEDRRFNNTEFSKEQLIKAPVVDSSQNNEESSNTEGTINNVEQHCRAIILAQSRCFTLSLFTALHYKAFIHNMDVLAAMDQCEGTLCEIDITEYLKTICGHIKYGITSDVNLQSTECVDLKPIHRLIKDKFFKITNDAFRPIPTNQDFYYCRDLMTEKYHGKVIDSDDEISSTVSENYFIDKEKELNSCYANILRLDNHDILKYNSPLFLHFLCTVRLNNGMTYKSVRLLPTCLGEVVDATMLSDINNIRVSFDILCLTLPNDVQNVINCYSTKDLKNSSFNSESFQSSSVDSNYGQVLKETENLPHIADFQKRAIYKLKHEITWLLQDEIATALLDIEPVTSKTLSFVMNHVNESFVTRPSCMLKKIDLHFVYKSQQSHEKFVREFCCIKIPNYKLSREGDIYYLVKNPSGENNPNHSNDCEFEREDNGSCIYKSIDNVSDISSFDGSLNGTEMGYEDVSVDGDDYNWLNQMNNKRPNLSNFWLITQIEKDVVSVYFHCRYLQLPTRHVEMYPKVQRAILDGIRNLCKCVNQSLLLQSLHDTKICNQLLEPDDNDFPDWGELNAHSTRNARLKSMDEINDELETTSSSQQIESSIKFKPGDFSCPVVWEIHFILHQRLKTGPGKSGLSIGISALKTILDKFSVTNRSNMFVYKDNNSNVFYLRLHENVQNCLSNKGGHFKSVDYEQPVSRSPSITSLPVGGPHKSNFNRSDFSISSTASSDVRPRVRSFGEKDTKDGSLTEDTVTLKVYGITNAKDDIRCELMQVLQNRLDDAVLELISVMLSRNAMCPLTPEDVHFLQKPFKIPEHIIKLSIQDCSLSLLDSFIHYLKQNLLQFLNVPKYTDSRPESHFKDYMTTEYTKNMITEDNIFIYNQSQNPSSGSRGIACIALAIIENDTLSPEDEPIQIDLTNLVVDDHLFKDIVAYKALGPNDVIPPVYLEFRIWKQGRVNYEILHDKLCAATSHSTWDIVMEYHFLKFGLCKELSESVNQNETSENSNGAQKRYELNGESFQNVTLDTSLEYKHICDNEDHSLDCKYDQFINRRKPYKNISHYTQLKSTLSIDDDTKQIKTNNFGLKPLEIGEEGQLEAIFQKNIQSWLEFAICLNVPSVKKIAVNLTLPNPLYSTVKEINSIISSFPQESVKCFSETSADNVYVPYTPSQTSDTVIIISRNFDQWKVSTSEDSLNIGDVISPHTSKHVFKFLYTIVGDKLIPRQKLLWGLIKSNSIDLYVYNWSKDNVVKLRNHSMNITNWLNIRACTLNSSCAQKIGLFHNQAIDRTTESNNPYVNCIGDVELMMKCPKDKFKKVIAMDCLLLESFRDNHKSVPIEQVDSVVALTVEMFEIRKGDKKQKDELKKLYSMCQSRTNTSTQSQVQLLLQNSRIIHYCHTPILFLSRWRLQAAATRDYTLFTPSNATPPDESEDWHESIYSLFVVEYRRYLQTLGFMSLDIDCSKNNPAHSKNNICVGNIVYMQKAILGGLLLFSIQLSEPFFIIKLYAIECNRIQSANSRASMNQFTQTFLDECDRVKMFMHLHSFTYDFHLRSIYNYISNNPGHKVCDGYHLIHFLDDFMKYYNKAPNYARNLVHADSIMISNLLTEGKQLYTYLLSNVKQYNFNVIDMQGLGEGNTEYVLVQVSNISDVSYKDSQDRQHTDDFDITLIISNICPSYSGGENILNLKYYLILTSGREKYPKIDVERKLGKFRTVSSTSKTLNLDTEKFRDFHECEQSINSDKNSDRISNSDKSLTFPMYPSDEGSTDENNKAKPKKRLSHIEIKQESVNYLGYYSSHEQLMQQLILNCADNTQKTIREMVTQGTVHCRTDFLWSKLLSQQECSQLTYLEFVELKGLSRLENIGDIHSNLSSLLNQPFSWYQGLAKLLLYKYQEQHRCYFSEDGNIQHYVILHPRYVGAFMMLSIDLYTSRGDLYAVYKAPHNFEDSDICISDKKMLLDGFINCICFYLWSEMI